MVGFTWYEMKITENTFYVVEVDGGMTVHDQRSDAVDELVDTIGVGTARQKEDEFSISEFTGDDEWEMLDLSWRSIAIDLMGKMESEDE